MEQTINELKELEKISSSKAKQFYIEKLYKENPNSDFFKILNFLLDPNKPSGLSKSKLNKKVKVKVINLNLNSLVEVVEYLVENNTGRDKDISVIQDFIVSNREHEEILKKIFTKTLKLGITAKTVNQIIPNFISVIEFMRAKNYIDRFDLGKFNFEKEYQISKKIDGIRCAIVKDKGEVKAFSRQGKEIDGLIDIIEYLKMDTFVDGVYDGELEYTGECDTEEERFQNTCSIVNSKSKEKKNLRLIIFDYIPVNDFFDGCSDVPYKNRIDSCVKMLYNAIEINPKTPLTSINNLPYYYRGKVTHEQLEAIVETCDKVGDEGIMINDLYAGWEGKRTSNILKFKKNLIADVEVIDMTEGEGKHLGVLGSIKVRFYYNEKFNYCYVGSGFTDEERKRFWNNPEEILGKIVEVKYQKITKAEDSEDYALGFASYNHRIREDKRTTNV